ncbi:MAG: Rhodanese-like protein [Acidobacteriaceae bacterium]|nr:Rhodanese-like protein [Acidobacteriaceae bacterium]
MSHSLQLQELTAAQIEQKRRRGTFILDTRAAERFASFHIRGAVQIGLRGPFASWAALLIKPTQELLLVAEDAACAQEAAIRLARVGLVRLVGFAIADKKQWQESGVRLVSLPIRWCKDVSRNLRESHRLQLIDVRSSAEWLKGHLPGAISIPLLELNLEAASLDLSKPTLVYCHQGYRAMTAVSLLLRSNGHDLGILIDGIEGAQAYGVHLDTSTG